MFGGQTHNPDVKLPAFPVREACKAMKGPFTAPDSHDLFAAMAEASGVFYNVSGASVSCYELPNDPDFDGSNSLSLATTVCLCAAFAQRTACVDDSA